MGATSRPIAFLDFLPAIFRRQGEGADDLLRRFLVAFEALFEELEDAIEGSLPGVVRYLARGRTRLPLVRLHDQERIEIRCDEPMALQLDGEDLGDITEAVFEAERDAVTVLVG